MGMFDLSGIFGIFILCFVIASAILWVFVPFYIQRIKNEQIQQTQLLRNIVMQLDNSVNISE